MRAGVNSHTARTPGMKRTPILSNDKALVTGGDRLDIDAATFAIEFDEPVDQREQRKVIPLADVTTGMKAIADLADEDISGPDRLAAELLHASALGIRISAVATGSLTLFMCHDCYPQSS